MCTIQRDILSHAGSYCVYCIEARSESLAHFGPTTTDLCNGPSLEIPTYAKGLSMTKNTRPWWGPG